MKTLVLIINVIVVLLPGCAVVSAPAAVASPASPIELPRPRSAGPTSVEQALASRHSVRTFRRGSLSLAEVSQLLWAAQGITHGDFRTAPSAGALYPLEIHVVVGEVDGLAPGVYRYVPDKHGIEQRLEGDVRESLSLAALWQEWAGRGAIALVFTAVYERTTWKYGERGVRYAHIEVGHAAQNVYLQAEALGLGTVMVGAFNDAAVRKLLRLPDDEQPLAIMPVGRGK